VIEVIEKIPYIDSTATTTTETGGVGSTTVQQVEFEEVGVILTIRPTIGEDDIIKLKITPEVKELRGFFAGIPVTERRKVDTTVLVRSGGSVVIGGLLRENEFEIESKVPFLGDIPFIGAAFRFRQRRLEKNELLILVTPHLISVDEDSMAEEGKDHLEKTKKAFDRGGFKRSFDLIW
jgi:type II secretory pathway component GspD/PulD (secretin)